MANLRANAPGPDGSQEKRTTLKITLDEWEMSALELMADEALRTPVNQLRSLLRNAIAVWAEPDDEDACALCGEPIIDESTVHHAGAGGIPQTASELLARQDAWHGRSVRNAADQARRERSEDTNP